MRQESVTNVLLIEEGGFQPPIIKDEAEQLDALLYRIASNYDTSSNGSTEERLYAALKADLPDATAASVHSICEAIVSQVRFQENKKADLRQAIDQKQTSRRWFVRQLRKATSHMSVQQSSEYLQGLDEAVAKANWELVNTIRTKTGSINQNQNLDGFIAEQYHAQTFNLNAEATGSLYRAEVLKPDGGPYNQNSVDIVIKETTTGKVVKRYQSKYYRTADKTAAAFKEGDYRGQQKLVPKDQEAEILTRCTSILEAPDGTKSAALTKTQAKEMQTQAQSGNWEIFDWNTLETKQVLTGLAKQIGYAGLLGAAVGAGVHVMHKVRTDEEIKVAEVAEAALASGADFGLKAVAAGALKIGAEKGILSFIPKGTPADVLAGVAFVAVENVKTMRQICIGELGLMEGIERIEQTTISTTAGVLESMREASIGGAIGMMLGPIGAIAGSIAGGAIGYMAGSAGGEAVAAAWKKVREFVWNGLRKMGEAISKKEPRLKKGTGVIA